MQGLDRPDVFDGKDWCNKHSCYSPRHPNEIQAQAFYKIEAPRSDFHQNAECRGDDRPLKDSALSVPGHLETLVDRCMPSGHPVERRIDQSNVEKYNDEVIRQIQEEQIHPHLWSN